MVAIRVLPPEVVHRIAAGEVIERPASVAKELIENAIDAGARRISVQIEDGGRKLIRIRDDGCGMEAEDLRLAFESHATSKYPEDSETGGEFAVELFGVRTLGFRGEALASIASVAEVDVVSRSGATECAHRYRPGTSAAGREAPQPASGPVGTTFEVRNLFFNTPARRKFLKAPSTEQSHIVDAIVRLALGFPHIGFRVLSGERVLLDLESSHSVRERIESILGAEKARELVDVVSTRPLADADGEDVAGEWLRGVVGRPSLHRSDSRGQYFFVNRRWVRDRVLSQALKDGFQGFQIPGRQPISYLFLELPSDHVDINVHPQKTEVRFRDSQAIYRGVRQAVRRALETLDLPGLGAGTARMVNDLKTASSAPPAPSAAPASSAPPAPRSEAAAEAAVDGFRTLAAKRGGGGAAPWSRGAPTPSVSPAAPASPSVPLERPRPPRVALQILDTYVVTERDGALTVFDQHALHEKVLYERILRRLREGEIVAQRLLLPQIVRLPPELMSHVPALIEQLAVFGFELGSFGDHEVAVQAIPTYLDQEPAAELVEEVASWISQHPDGESAGAAGVVDRTCRKIAALMACKQAVKAGHRLEAQEIQALLEEAETATDPRYCPHGRPTSIAIDRRELERRFDRK